MRGDCGWLIVRGEREALLAGRSRRLTVVRGEIACCSPWLAPLLSFRMNLTQLTSADLQRIARLLEQKEALQARVEGINHQLAAYDEPTGAATVTEAKPGATTIAAPRRKPKISVAGRARIAAAQKARWAKVKRAAGSGTAVKPVAQPKPAKPGLQKRGGLKESVVALVKASGQHGITVAEVAAKLGAKPRRIFDWFKSTGKGVKEIKKVGRARYGWLG